MEKLESDKGNLAVMFMIIFILIVIIILGVFLYFRYYSESAEEDVKIEFEETVPSTEEKEEMDYEQIKRDIATGKLDEIPEGIDKSKRLIIREYLYDCYMIEDMNKKLECYEDHYFNVDPELKQQKNTCEQMQGNEKTECLDQLYFELANEKQSAFCNVVVDPNLKEECSKIG